MTCENPYRVYWNRGYSFNDLQGIRDRLPVNPTRLITIQTEKARVCLMAASGVGFYFVPAKYENGVWRRIPARDICVDSVGDDIFTGESQLYAALERQMLLQFRYSAAGYYSDLPMKDVVVRTVTQNPTVRGLKDSKFSYYQASVEEDPEYDGAFEVFCDEGSLLIPYVGSPHADNTTLLIEYITFVKASDAESVLDRLGQRLDDIVEFVGNIHWSNLRNKLEGVWN